MKINENENNSIDISIKKNNKEPYSYDIEELEKIIINGDITYNDNKILIVKEIKEYVKMIMKIDNNEVKEIRLINSDYIFEEWKNSFNKNYKADKKYKSIVKDDHLKDLKISEIKEALTTLIPETKFEIFSEDPSKFENMIKKVY